LAGEDTANNLEMSEVGSARKKEEAE